MERIYAPENEKRFVGHPVHYLITAGDKAAADDMIDLLIPALLENQTTAERQGLRCAEDDIQGRAGRIILTIFSPVPEAVR